MSTNPFRRSSLKNSSAGGGSENNPAASALGDIPGAGDETPPRLHVSTTVPQGTQKHVNFASPPAIPISPVSYPPSPESSRNSPAFAIANPILPSPVDYNGAIKSNPFRVEAGIDEDDGALEQAIENARANITRAASSIELQQQDAVQNTLSRFASAPKQPAAVNRKAPATPSSNPVRQTMDVDAFKRLLLTGDAEQNSRRDESANVSTVPSYSMNDSSSGTDTASTSQRSLFDQGPMSSDSPRSSEEIDSSGADAIRQSLKSGDTVMSKKKPPPPPPVPRHGKSTKPDPSSRFPDNPIVSQETPISSAAKKPPTPPITRRRSQNSAQPTPIHSRTPSSSELDQNLVPASINSRAPPPPKSRRPAHTSERRPSSDLPTTMEETDSAESALSSSRKSSDTRPPPPRARNSSKHVVPGGITSPPPPPPRRGRGSSRSSMDSLRPAELNPSEETTNESSEGKAPRFDLDSRQASTSSNANDILADLAALQREVDEARSQARW